MIETQLQFGWNAAFLGGLSSIALIDLVLSGDNSIVIAMAVQSLAPQKRKWGLLLGAGAAAALRIAFTFGALWLLNVPFLKLIGGALIFWIAVKLLSQPAETGGRRGGSSLWNAVGIIVVADVSMSLDNVLAVAGAAQGHSGLLWFGLGLSIPLVVFASGLLSRLMDRFPVILIAGAVILGKVGGEMIAEDPAGQRALAFLPHADLVLGGLGALVMLGFGIWRRRRKVDSAKHENRPG